MGDEGTEHRLTSLEKSADKNEITLGKLSEKVTIIEKLNIQQDVSLKIIIWLGKALLTVFITLIGTNVWMYFDKR